MFQVSENYCFDIDDTDLILFYDVFSDVLTTRLEFLAAKVEDALSETYRYELDSKIEFLETLMYFLDSCQDLSAAYTETIRLKYEDRLHHKFLLLPLFLVLEKVELFFTDWFNTHPCVEREWIVIHSDLLECSGTIKKFLSEE